MGMCEQMFEGQSYKFGLTNNKSAFKFSKDKSVSTWQSGEFDRTISFKNMDNSIHLIYTL